MRLGACTRGVTLIELMVVLALIAILLTIGVPSYQSFTTSNRMSGELNNLLGDLQYARAEAIKLGRPVVVCTSSDGATCTGASNWMVGRIVYADVNNDGTVQASEILRVQPALTSTDTF
ncbi:MAG: GspH/FimT family pseudopilin, partial [Betaproteobacteria bacterium]|nr:GspH/FimT family pseudopilin [Betaproteobacteria bacterium]